MSGSDIFQHHLFAEPADALCSGCNDARSVVWLAHNSPSWPVLGLVTNLLAGIYCSKHGKVSAAIDDKAPLHQLYTRTYDSGLTKPLCLLAYYIHQHRHKGMEMMDSAGYNVIRMKLRASRAAHEGKFMNGLTGWKAIYQKAACKHRSPQALQ